MKIQCVIVCVNYDDFLSITLPFNKNHIDDITVVTVKNDLRTQKICKENGAKIVITDRLYENGDKFNKGKAINDGFNSLVNPDWVLHLDADMILPHDFKDKIQTQKLEIDKLYGITRLMCPNYDAWSRYVETGRHRPRWPHQRRRINIGVGFFQLFNAKCPQLSEKPWYPEEYGHAGRSDRFFMRKIRQVEGLNMVGIHIDNDSMGMGTNWNGRITAKIK
jgi:glycosyltransferase involved in cell wall biosynthesis